MLSEPFLTSIRAQPKTANTAIAKDIGIYLHELHPTPTIKSSFKKSSTPVNALAASSTHIFAAQADKAVVHVYSRERGNQEALISFPERIHSLTLVGDTVLALGTAEGRVILWEVCTGRQVSTPAAHLQKVSTLAATQSHLLSGSDDSNIHVWSLPNLLSLSSKEISEPLRTLSNHQAAVTSFALGHSASTTNICVSAGEDSTVIVWNYLSGDLLRTFLLSSTPLCLAVDPCDRAVYVGFKDGSIQMIEFLQADSAINPLYDSKLQNTPVQPNPAPWTAPNEEGSTLCIGLSYDGTCLLSGHASGKIASWDTGRRLFSSEIADLNAPVTNLIMQSPFPEKRATKAATVVKPKLGEGNYIFNAQWTRSLGESKFAHAVNTPGFPSDMLADAISRFFQPAVASSSGDEQLRKENEELWKIINDQRALQKKTWDKYTKLRAKEA
ncbi:related to WD-repeat protein CRB3 [Phialocephala subalpina]|uniref:Pre-rRNA-processing protein IPI3 n=1 Tax=Phialocephala subalpina TaxID=576137 RepID=A0A1L7X0M7_9HELO|nr:related to WD-repeat protein CRB3 [Phialocephala subalpina]